MRAFLIAVLTLSLGACQLVYKLPTRQGNVIEQKQLDQLQLGMTRDQVKFLVGTPVASSPFRPDRWDYVGYYRSPRGEVSERTVSLFFDGNKLSKMEGIQLASGQSLTQAPDAKTVLEQKKKEALEDSRAGNTRQTGVVIEPPQPAAPETPQTQEPDQIPNP
ncbi:MAG: outer membrane protein assembly factor BamE [Stenotrophobium sp.]